MNKYSEKDFSKILKKNAQTLRHQFLAEGTDAMRIYDRNLRDFPVTVDLYSNWARVVDFGEEPFSEEEKNICLDIVSRFAYVDSSKIVYVYRAKREKGQQHEKNDTEPIIVDVKERNLSFKTNLSSYTDTGLFLDHTNTREFIRQQSEGKDILNLFSYTGSFSVYAASGLAKSVTSVDLSATYTKWAEENLSENGFEGTNYPCVCMDASKFIDLKIDENVKYDVIIFDPPSFSNSHKMKHDFDVQRDFVYWCSRLVGLLRDDGFILFSTNLSDFKMDRRCLKGLSIKEITAQMWADGFVKGRKGTVRSWMMSKDDDSLSLDWSKDTKPSEEKKDSRRNGRRENRHERSERRFENRPRRSGRSFDRDDRPRRSGRSFDRDDRPRRRYDDEPRRPERSFDRDDRPRRRYDDEPRRPERSFDRDYRPGRRYDDEPRRPERSFDRDDRPRRRYDDEPRRPERSFDRDDRPRRRYDDEPRRPRRQNSDKSEYRKPERDSVKKSKPYGFDSFKPARNRNDSADFFWNSDDIEKR